MAMTYDAVEKLVRLPAETLHVLRPSSLCLDEKAELIPKEKHHSADELSVGDVVEIEVGEEMRS